MVFNIRLITFVLLSAVSLITDAQDLENIYYKTRKFAELFLYGERKQDIGLQFGWKLDKNTWMPIGNGFTFLTEGLKLYDYKIEAEPFVEGKDSQWYINPDFEKNNAFAQLPNSLFDEQNLVTWSEESKHEILLLNAIMIEGQYDNEENVISCKLSINKNFPADSISFTAFMENDNNMLLFRVVNLTDNYIDLNINNKAYPCSPIGWVVQSSSNPGHKDVDTEVYAIHMKGNITVPSYSFTILQFPLKPQNKIIPPNILP